MAVLNRGLYSRLEKQFGAVRVSNAGQSFQGSVGRGENARHDIVHSGEYYSVCCAYCRDTRFRLYVNHMWGQRDSNGRRMTFLAVCYNEHCLEEENNYRDFVARLDDDGWLEGVRILEGQPAPVTAAEVPLPGPCTPLARLRASHPARVYLECDRGFDVNVLSERYGVSYCMDSQYFLARQRIIIPIFDYGKLKGWQARYIGELPWKDQKRKASLPPKYFSCPNSHFRSQCLYNWENTRKWTTGIIVEGPMDVWRFGAMACGIFGNTMTDYQRRRFIAVFAKRTAILLLDPEEFESRSTLRLVDILKTKMPNRFCAVRLPKGTDPGSLNRDVLRKYVKDDAARQGVKIAYRKQP